MAEYVNVAVDAMGGDNAPTEIVKGAVEAVNADKRVKVFLVGKEPVIREELKAYTYDAEQLEVVHAEEVIETAEPPVMAIRRKKDSSIVKAMYMVKNGECDAFVSAGSTYFHFIRTKKLTIGESIVLNSHPNGLPHMINRLHSKLKIYMI